MPLRGQALLGVPPELSGYPALEQVISIDDLVGEIGHEDGGKQRGNGDQKRLHGQFTAHEEAFMPEDSSLGRGSNAQNHGTALGQLDQVGVVALATIQFPHQLDRCGSTKGSFTHSLDLFQGNGLLERLRVPMNDRILHGFAVPLHEFLLEV